MMVNFVVSTVTLLVLSGSVIFSSGQDIPIIQGPNPQAPTESSTKAPQTQPSEVSCKDFKEECEGCVENANLCDYHYKCQDPQYSENDYWCMSLTMLDGLPGYCESCKTIEPGCKNVTEENCPTMAQNFHKGGIWQNIMPPSPGKGKCKNSGEPCQSVNQCCQGASKGGSCEDRDPSKPGPKNKTCIVFVAEENQKPEGGQGGTGSGNGNSNGNGSPFPFPARPTCNVDTCSANDKNCCNGKYCAVPKTVEEKYECKTCMLALGSVCFSKPESSIQCCGNRVRPSACALLDPGNKDTGICVECPMYNRQNKNAPCETDNNCCSSDSKETKYECRASEKDPNKKTCVKCVKENEKCDPDGAPCCFFPVGTACFPNFNGQGHSCQFSREEESKVNSTGSTGSTGKQ